MEPARQGQVTDEQLGLLTADAVHEFIDEDDPLQGGRWLDRRGELICSWEWEKLNNKLIVRCDSRIVEVYMSRTPPDAQTRLSLLALETAERSLRAK